MMEFCTLLPHCPPPLCPQVEQAAHTARWLLTINQEQKPQK